MSAVSCFNERGYRDFLSLDALPTAVGASIASFCTEKQRALLSGVCKQGQVIVDLGRQMEYRALKKDFDILQKFYKVAKKKRKKTQ